MAYARLLPLVALVALAAPARAAAPRTYELDVGPKGDWRADAVGLALAHDLADDRLAAAGSGSADLVVTATVDEAALRYEVRATWPGAPAPVQGAIALPGSRAAIAGQLRDQLHRLARTTSDGDTERSDVAAQTPGVGTVALALALAVLALAVPFVVGARRGVNVRALPALRRAAIAVGSAGGAALVATQLPVPWLLAGGLAWGTWAAVTLPIALPPVAGFGRIEQSQLARVLGAWLAAAGPRTLAVVLAYAPVAIGAYFACVLAGLAPTLALALGVPLALLAARLWVRCAAAVAAAVLDARLIDRTVDVDAWHAAARAYVVGYLRRAGLPVDVDLLARVQIVPATCDQVVAYGGGLAPSRIAVPRKMLELALAPAGRPHDYAAPRVSTLHWTQWNAGLVVPTETGAVIATREQRQPRALPDEGEHERQLFGEPPTLAGTIEPSDLDARKTYRPHEDRIWLDWDPGEEYDGTDPGDRDFLFGAIMHALCDVQRHDDRLATFVLLAKKKPRASALSDDHAALAGARHHLVQYLGWLLWQREDTLTARAFAPELEAATHAVAAHSATTGSMTRGAGTLGGAAAGDPRLVHRIARLAEPDRAPRWRRYAVAGALAGAVALAAVAVVGALRYHAVYVQETSHG